MNIILIGFMGSGKSSVAALLAQKIKWPIRETDELVKEQSGRKNIKELFLLDGEIRFRELEIEVAKQISVEKNIIISTGGGMVINKICLDYLKRDGRIIFLATSFGEIVSRLDGDSTRPLFQDRVAARKLFNFRKKLYQECADVTIQTDKKTVDTITNLIIKKI